jgi:hypothetical protein
LLVTMVLFSTDRKLLGEELGMEDLRHLHPAVYTNLTKLRTYDGNFEDLGLVFQVYSLVGMVQNIYMPNCCHLLLPCQISPVGTVL